MENNYIVYKHIFPNGKIYIGITSRKPNIRWGNGKGYRGTYLYNAINKYGWKNVKHDILFENLSKQEAEQKEIELIAKYKSNQRKYGYNIANGGSCKGKCSEETKIKISNANKGERNGMYGKPAWNKGKSPSIETRRKLSLSLKGIKRNEKSIKKQIATRKEKYPNGFEYSKKGIDNIIKQAKINILKAHQKSRKAVCQYDLKGNFIKEYNSISNASRKTNIPVSNISHVCLKRKGFKTAGGFIWKYASEQ